MHVFVLLVTVFHLEHHLILSQLEEHSEMMIFTFGYLMAPITENVLTYLHQDKISGVQGYPAEMLWQHIAVLHRQRHL